MHPVVRPAIPVWYRLVAVLVAFALIVGNIARVEAAARLSFGDEMCRTLVDPTAPGDDTGGHDPLDCCDACLCCVVTDGITPEGVPLPVAEPSAISRHARLREHIRNRRRRRNRAPRGPPSHDAPDCVGATVRLVIAPRS